MQERDIPRIASRFPNPGEESQAYISMLYSDASESSDIPQSPDSWVAWVDQFSPATRAILDRFIYHPTTPTAGRLYHLATWEIMRMVLFVLSSLPESDRDRAVALTKLEEFRMALNKAITFQHRAKA